MAESDTQNLAQRVAELERRLAELRTHVERLERALAMREENPTDRSVVQRRVVYDWQG